MAVNVVAFPVAARQNKNDDSTAYGKYFLVPWYPETLTLRGLIERVAFDQSVYSRDIVEGVIQKLTTVMVELLKSGQPVKWDGLGTFTPTVTCEKHGRANFSTVGVDQIQGVHIRFIPENAKGEQLTSRAFKDLCTFELVGRIETEKIDLGNGKYKYQQILYPLQEKVSAPQISGTTPFADTTTVTIATSSSNAKIYYTDDGSEPDQHATLYSGPITLSASKTIKAIAIRGNVASAVSSKSFVKQ